MRYKTEIEITEIVAAFENGTIKRDAWKHAEHLTLAAHYAAKYDYETAYEKMKSGIFNLLNSFGVDLSVEMPFHETLTVFWMQLVFGYLETNPDIKLLDAVNEIIEKFDKDYPLRFYSRELLFSVEARYRFIEPDAIRKS
jgi:hypothetical protein